MKQRDELVAIKEVCFGVWIGHQAIGNAAKSPEKSGQERSQLGEARSIEDESMEDHGEEVQEKVGEAN